MEINNLTSDEAVIRELGSRIARYRLNRNITQNDLADRSGLSIATLKRIEAGEHSTNVVNIIRILRELKLLDNMELLLSKEPISPLLKAKTGKKTRKRASSKSIEKTSHNKQWSWGNEKGDDA